MADKLSLIRTFLISEAQRRKGRFLIGPQKRVNGAALADAIGISSAWVSRILSEKPSKRPESQDPDWYPDGRALEKLKRFVGATTDSQFWEICEDPTMREGRGDYQRPHPSRRGHPVRRKKK